MAQLDFISDSDLEQCVRRVTDALAHAEAAIAEKMHRNAVDPFSAVFDAQWHGITLDAWLKLEKTRQIQKTMQNSLGKFHQDVLGSIPGWENLQTGHIVDIRNKKLKIVAEIKNKFNTTKGNHKVVVYDDLRKELMKPENAGYTGYYVEVIPKGRKRYDRPFVPSDNTRSKRRVLNEKIRVIDGSSFYDMASGKQGALKRLYEALPIFITRVNEKKRHEPIVFSSEFKDLYQRAFS